VPKDWKVTRQQAEAMYAQEQQHQKKNKHHQQQQQQHRQPPHSHSHATATPPSSGDANFVQKFDSLSMQV
jgi:hypothetical protein